MEWFKDWFNSPYYHILYQNRNEEEAEHFLNHLIEKLPLRKGAKILDLACGKGRHSLYLHKKGFEVVGVDLSKESIAYASQFETDGLRFVEGDMRYFQLKEKFDYVLNLFTSFGYFKEEKDESLVFKNIHQHLKDEGTFIQDYLHAEFVMKQLVAEEQKEIDGILFQIHRKEKDGFIVKEIDFDEAGAHYSFEERVKIFTLEDFQKMATENHFIIEKIYGNYQLELFDFQSPRMILIYKKQ